ncbi:MAG TPA: HipA N-terminal domain-containing protein, partial [Gemmatimonadaceae bacterium]|nr:HipA N-terminal domain-containing protein [Gemmatimonadaceae bacterium]
MRSLIEPLRLVGIACPMYAWRSAGVALGQRIAATRFWVAECEEGKPSAELGLALEALQGARLHGPHRTNQGWCCATMTIGERARAFPLSLSIPLAAREHGHRATSAFLSGLLPDDPNVVESWARLHGVSGYDIVALLAHVGEDCAGAVQLVRPADVDRVLGASGAAVGAITGDHWRAAARAVELPADLALDRIAELGGRIPAAIERVIRHPGGKRGHTRDHDALGRATRRSRRALLETALGPRSSAHDSSGSGTIVRTAQDQGQRLRNRARPCPILNATQPLSFLHPRGTALAAHQQAEAAAGLRISMGATVIRTATSGGRSLRLGIEADGFPGRETTAVINQPPTLPSLPQSGIDVRAGGRQLYVC